MIFSDFPPSNIVKLENVGPMFSSFRPLLSYSSVATTVENNFHDLYGAFSKVRQLLVDFQLIPTPSLDF